MNQFTKEKLIYLRQWVGESVNVTTMKEQNYAGMLTNIVFDGSRLMYIMLDDKVCLNYDHVIEISVKK